MTEMRVREFQKANGLIINGIADKVTLAKIDELLSEPLRMNMSRGDVVSLKVNLSTLGFHVSNNPTPFFGPITEARVREFQQYFGLTVNGVADVATLNKIDEILASPFRVGQRHASVIKLKENLDKLGHHISPNPTNLYGPRTEQAVREFQRRYGLRENGIGDPVTLEKIEHLLTAPLSNGMFRYDVVDLKVNLGTLGFGVSNNPTIFFGPITERAVRDFQRYYGLQVTGVANSATLAMISEILASPFRNGQRHQDTIQLKIDLGRLGFPVSDNPTTLYGSRTERVVRQFQAQNGLRVNGIADKVTLAKIAELLEVMVGTEVVTYTQYNLTLAEAAVIQSRLNPPPQTDLYRNSPGFIHSSAVNIIERGTITGSSVNIRTAPTTQSSVVANVSLGTAIVIEATVQGQAVGGNNQWYQINFNGETLFVHSSLASISKVAVVNSNNTRVRDGASTSRHIYGTVNQGTELVVLREVTGATVSGSNRWFEVRFRVWRNARKEDFIKYLDPTQNDRFQHLVLDAPSGVTVRELNKVLTDRGVLNGLGQAFIEAGRTHSVNEIYLIAHALLETGNGRSGLATGIEVGRNSSGNLEIVTSSNRSRLTNIRTTHNMFGIGAKDSDPHRLGAFYAYNAGWFTPEAAIIGGAAFISNSYFQRGQNTLYKMRWNHAFPSTPGGSFFPQYATDMGWAVKQVPRIKSLYDQLDNPTLRFDIVRFREN
ncbi:MAG: peptidoglycan-binding protein [Bacillaceae bacterium]|nr:peptidoglycan-binding protein [Bacillaceae bacterium]